jgi:hypothetical protein
MKTGHIDKLYPWPATDHLRPDLNNPAGTRPHREILLRLAVHLAGITADTSLLIMMDIKYTH